jgi:hypothetical protein
VWTKFSPARRRDILETSSWLERYLDTSKRDTYYRPLSCAITLYPSNLGCSFHYHHLRNQIKTRGSLAVNEEEVKIRDLRANDFESS